MITENRMAAQIPEEKPVATRPERDCLSSVFRRLRELYEEDIPSGWDVHASNNKTFHLLVASTPELRERAFRLGARIYKQSGYIPQDGPDLLCSRFDARPDTFVLLVTDPEGRDAATLTLVFDSEGDGLPLDDVYRAEADQLRARGRRVAEYVRLAMDNAVRGCWEVLVHLFSFGTIYSWRVMNYDDFVITVHPRHVSYYQRLLGFEVIGGARSCPKVQNAPAELLRLRREYMDERIRATGGRCQRSRADRSLYPFFYAPEAEPFIAAFLKHRHKPMTREEAEKFALKVVAETKV